VGEYGNCRDECLTAFFISDALGGRSLGGSPRRPSKKKLPEMILFVLKRKFMRWQES